MAAAQQEKQQQTGEKRRAQKKKNVRARDRLPKNMAAAATMYQSLCRPDNAGSGHYQQKCDRAPKWQKRKHNWVLPCHKSQKGTTI